jgi:hypothetical protein
MILEAEMAFEAVSNGAKAVVVMSQSPRLFTNTLWFTKTLFTLEDQETLASVVDSYFGLPMLAYISDQAGYVKSQVYDMRFADGPVVSNDTNAGVGAVSAGGSMPISSSICLTLRTANRGRSGRGRIYLAGFAESQWTNNEFSSGLEASLETLWSNFQVACGVVGWTPCVVSRYLNGAHRTTALAQPITSGEVRSLKEAHQRRRTARP